MRSSSKPTKGKKSKAKKTKTIDLNKTIADQKASLSKTKKLLKQALNAQKIAETNLKENQRRFDALLTNSFEAMGLFDENFNIIYRSPAAYRISGWTHEDLAKNPPITNIHPDDKEELVKKLAIAKQTKEHVYVMYRSMHKLGHYMWVEGRFTNMLDDPDIKAIVLNIRDISSRKNAEDEIVESAERFRTLIERISDAFISFDKDLRYTYVNKKAGEITQRDPDSLIGKYVWDVFPEAIGSSTYEAFNKAMEEQVYLCNTDYFEPLNLWQENHLYPSESGLSVFIRDISERKRAEKKLIESEQRFRSLIESSTDAIVLADENLKVHYQTPAAERITGISLTYRDQNPGVKFTHPDDIPAIDKALKEANANPGQPVFFQSRLLHIKGEYIWIEGFMTNQLHNPNVKAMVFNYRDISERKNSEAEILQLKDELEEKVIKRTQQLEALNKELESFTYSVSHDLRAPLRIIDGFSQIILEDYGDQLDASGKKNLNVIVNNAKRMGMLIDDLLNFSKVGKAELRITTVNMTTVVRDVLEELTLGGTVIPTGLQICELTPVKGDSALLKQVWINLISNAIKYSGKKENPEVKIDCYQEEGKVVYSVKDNGAGFDMKYKDKLFGVFQRLHKLEEFTGTGVGLALVQRIVSRHGGSVWAEAKLNEGATFYFSLPVQS